ncbi:MAG: hypothetical protein NVS3B20_08900 [Polyangiales bacterium]
MNTQMGHPGPADPSDPQTASRMDPATTPTAPMPTREPSRPSPPRSDQAGSKIRVHLFGRTDVGRIREHNEDNFLIADLSQNARGLMENIRTHVVGPHGTLFAVCDGMGGAAAGEVASKLAVDIIYEQMQAGGPPRGRDDLARRLVRAVEVAGLRIFAEAKLDRNRRGMGTTATAAALIDDHLFLAQVGDSRGYVLRGDHFELVTRDQSLVNQLIEAGQLTEEEAENFEHSNIILQALGTADSVQVDLTVVKLRDGDTLLLCSDGLSGMVRAEEMRQALLAHAEPIDVCKVLTDRANEAGGHDNITVIIAKFEGGPKPSASDEPVKYTKYVFQADDGSSAFAPPAPSVHPAPQSDPVSQPIVEHDPSPPGPLPSLTSARPDAARGPAGSVEVARHDSHPEALRSHTESEMRAAGLPGASAMSPWIWIATILALGLVGVGLYALFGGNIR